MPMPGYFFAMYRAMSWWLIFLAPALSRILHHWLQLFPVLARTALSPILATLPLPFPFFIDTFSSGETDRELPHDGLRFIAPSPASRRGRRPHRRSRWSPCRIHDDGRSVAQHLGDALHDLVGIVPDAHHGVRAQLLGVLQHLLEGVGPRLLAQLREQGDVPSHDRLQRRAQRADHRSGAVRDPPHDAERLLDLEAIEGERRRGHRLSHGSPGPPSGWTAGWRNHFGGRRSIELTAGRRSMPQWRPMRTGRFRQRS